MPHNLPLLFAEPQVGALCWRYKGKAKTLQILLVTSRETKRWVIPKGWPMEGLKDWNAARREAYEEAGVEGHMHKQPVGQFNYPKRKKNGRDIPCRVDIYPLEVTEQRATWPEAKERKRKWFEAHEAASLVLEPELADLIKNFHP
jgi:8-oxo-dGTP pyrophosphatase MutT (NUDIX family)